VLDTASLGLGSAGLLLAGGAARAGTPGVDMPPQPGTPRSQRLPALTESRLANGLALLHAQPQAEGANLPLVSIQLVLRTGSLADPPGRAGLADLLASLLGKGAYRHGKPVDAPTLARQAEALGSALNTSAGSHLLGVSMTVMPRHLEAALALMADVLRRPWFTQAELERSRQQAIDGLKFGLADPAALASRVARKLWWGEGALGAITTAASLARVSLAELQAFHGRWARPDAAALVLSGDVSAAQARQLAERYLGDWSGPQEPLPAWPTEAPAPHERRTLIVNLPGAGQSAVMLLAPSVTEDSTERRVAQVANEVLGGGYSARLNQEVRIRRGLAYGASSRVDLQRGGGQLAASAQTGNDHAIEVARLLQQTVQSLAGAAVPGDELQARLSTLSGHFARRFDTCDGVAAMLSGRWSRGRPVDELSRTAAEWQAVTAEAVQAHAAALWTDPARQRIVIVGDLAQIGPGWREFAPEALVIESQALDLDQPLPRGA
ncbi:MAG: hypothetical protein RL722_2876, partial [Pseudomonadota bacterium]|jgi:zinc protease